MFRLLALIFLVAAAAVAVVDLATSFPNGAAGRLAAFGEWWVAIDTSSLQLLQAGVQRHVAPWLWDGVIQPLLEMPLAIILLVCGGLFWLLRRRKERDGRSRRTGSGDIG